MPGCGKADYLSVRSSVPVAQLQEQFPRQCKVGSPDCVKAIVNLADRGRPPRHCVMCRRRSRCVWKISISASMCPTLATEMLQSGTCMFYVPGCSVSLNLELFCGTTNVNEPKRGNAASIDIDALLQEHRLQVISLRHGPQFRDEGKVHAMAALYC